MTMKPDHGTKPGEKSLAVQAAAVSNTQALQTCMASAGWEITYVDLNLIGLRPKVEIKLERCDGRWLLARVDNLGRASIETFQRERSLGLNPNTTGRRPLSPQIDDLFLGRRTCMGPRHLLKEITNYIADNATSPVRLADVRQAWAAVMGAPLLMTSDSIEHGDKITSPQENPGTKKAVFRPARRPL